MSLTQSGTSRLVGSDGTLGSAFPGATVVRWNATITPKDPKVIEVAGEASTLINASGGEIELSVEVLFVAVGTAATPAPGTNCSLSGFTQITCLGVADALNSGGGKWRFMGATINALTDDAHTGTVNFKKWIGVTLS